MWLSVPEAAERLGVNESRVRRRIVEGSLQAEKVGGRWLIDEDDIAPVRERIRGRPLSERSAWGMIGAAEVLAGGNPELLDSLPPMDRSKARLRLRNLLAHHLGAEVGSAAERGPERLAVQLRNLLRNRAERLSLSTSPLDLDDLRADDRIVLSGLSRARSGIASGSVVEGYVRADDLSDVVDAFLLEEARDADANVFLHVVRPLGAAAWSLIRGCQDNWLLLAADLADHRKPREEGRAFEVIRQAAEDLGR